MSESQPAQPATPAQTQQVVPQRQMSQTAPQPTPAQQPPQQQQQQQQQQQPTQQQPIQQQSIQQMPQLQQIAPQQPQHVMPNLQAAHAMTSVPLSMTMAAANPMNGSLAGTGLRPQQLGQLPQVQVIHQAMQSPPYMSQFTYNQQQQLMLQNMQAAMQANVMNMNPQQINMANMVAMQGRAATNMFTPAANLSQTPTTPTTPNILSMSSGTSSQMTSTTTGSTNAGKPAQATVMAKPQQQQQQQQGNIQQQPQQQQQQPQIHTIGQVQPAQATAMVGNKPIILGQAAGNALLQGQIGVISAGQLPTTQAYAATGQAFGQIQSKQTQQIGVATNTGQGQAQLISSQSPIRFSQSQLTSNAGSAQLISSQPVFTNQMLQAMASQLQHYPQQSIMSAQGQSPTIIAGQGLYIRSANPVQAQGLMAGVQAAINPTFKGSTQPAVQSMALPIQKQTTAAQTGKVLLPSVSKTVTAKVPPTSMSIAGKVGAQVMAKPKGRPKGSVKSTTPVSSVAGTERKTDSPVVSTASKPSTPTNQLTATVSHDSKNQSDSEMEVPKKIVSGDEAQLSDSQTTEEKIETKSVSHISDSQTIEEKIETKSTPIIVPVKTSSEPVVKPDVIADPPVEKQRAIVKPHILTHVIEGFVIQEGPEPFPVQRSSLLTEFIPPKPGQPVEQSSLISMDDEDVEPEEASSPDTQGSSKPQQTMLCCECCKVLFPAPRTNLHQRFCSKSCAKRFSIGCTKRLQHFPGRPKEQGRGVKRKPGKRRKGWRGNRLNSAGSAGLSADVDMEDQSSSVSPEDTPSPSTTPDLRLQTPPPDLQVEGDGHTPSNNLAKWNVEEVYEFVRSLPGCTPYAEEFRSQEIDGQALLLLKEDHLMTTMNMKLGPALKICARINAIKEEQVG